MGIKLEAIKNLLKNPVTIAYPGQKANLQEKFRGKVTFDKSKCIGCGLCRAFCPSECIRLGFRKQKMLVNNLEHQKAMHPIKSIDAGKCIRCGMCIDICPVKCIWFSKDFELADKDKNNFVNYGIK